MRQPYSTITPTVVRHTARAVLQVWVWLTWQLAPSRQARPKAWLGDWPLQRLLAWLAAVLQRKYRQSKVIALQQPLLWPEGLQP